MQKHQAMCICTVTGETEELARDASVYISLHEELCFSFIVYKIRDKS